jgi:hypothetical protein
MIMRVEKFDAKDIEALRALNFEIAADNETAKLNVDVAIEIYRPHNGNQFWLEITLPDGTELFARCTREDLFQAAGTLGDE